MDRMKVLGVSPKFPDTTYWSFSKALSYLGKRATMPPTGLATVMAMLPEKNFEPLPIRDLNVEPLRDEYIDEADIVFTTTMLVQEKSHNEVISRVHKRGKKVVAGGPFPSSYPERNRNVDHIVAGEAEVTLNPFLEDLVNRTAQRVYTEQNVKGRIKYRLTKTGRVDITDTPVPRWDLVKLQHYGSAAIQYSRGCPFDCEFCDIIVLNGREPRTKTPEQMNKELDALVEAGHKGSVFIVDDNFIGNRKNVENLLPYLIAWQKKNRHPYSFFTEASSNLALDSFRKIREQMVEAGFTDVFVGFESPDLDVLRKMSKTQNILMDPIRVVRILQESGLGVYGGFIIGNDGEKENVFEGMFDFIQDAGIVNAMPGLLTALNETRLYKRLEKEGRLRGGSSGNNTHRLEFNFEPELDEKFLIEGYKKLIGDLYSPENYFERCRILQDNSRKRNLGSRLNRESLTALLKSMSTQLVGRGGKEYSKYLARTLVKNPRYFPEAVAEGVKFAHFDSITRATLKADEFVPVTEGLYEKFKFLANRIHERHKHDSEVVVSKLSKAAKRVLSRAERKYNKIHDDFKSGYEHALESLKNRVWEHVRSYHSGRLASLYG